MDEFFFPNKPYKIQEEFCKQAFKLYNTEGGIGIFQSPTGTGKTLSILCSSISWLYKSFFNCDNQEINTESNSSLPPWVLNTINKQKQESSSIIVQNKKLFHEYIKNEILSSPSNKSFNEIISELEISFDDLPINYKIFITSRTHSQLSQYIDEIKKIKKNSNNQFIDSLSIVPLASRTQLCVHNKVKKYNSSIIKDVCHSYTSQRDVNKDKCTFKEGSIILAKKCLLEPLNIEELCALALELNACPYYATKIASQFSDIVLLPYNIVFNKVSRDSFKLKLCNKNALLIIDEAHNLINTLESSNRVSITLESSLILFEACEKIISLDPLFLKGENLSLLKQLIRLVKSIYFGTKNLILNGKKRKSNEYNMQEDSIVLNPIEFMTLNNIDSFNISKIYNFIIEKDLCKKIKGVIIRYEKEFSLKYRSSDDLQLYSNSLFVLKEFLDFLIYSDKKFDIVVIEPASNNEGNDNYSITLIPINVQSRFNQVALNTKTTMLVGGTLEPISEFSPLFKDINTDKIVNYSASYKISRDNLLFLTIPKSIDNQVINLKYEFRTCEVQLKNISQIISLLSSEIPDGICVFFSSYNFLEIFYKHLFTCEESKKHLNLIMKNKKIFREKKNQNKNILEQYKDHIMNDRCNKGAILFAVLNGTLSEGVNFSDKLCRGLIIISLPFPQNSRLLISKENYFKENICDNEEQYRKIMCMKTVNQCIGRAIRHKNDYSAIILIDSRYESLSVMKMLPNWLQDHINTYLEWDFEKNIICRIREFFRKKKI
ncbi:helicase [Cryptosporidium bovis]|uniref:helicase n=1 Tax=Cryptosporidium bovis TaxID=310047 RepID=UPI00351A1879|nr:helicase [Cryptosporidium bovis]